MLRVPYGSQAAVEFADPSMEQVAYTAYSASADLADERGSYSTFRGSLWGTGKAGQLNAVPTGAAAAEPKFCAIHDPDCEACQ